MIDNGRFSNLSKERKDEIIQIMPRMAKLREAAEVTPFSYYALRKLCLENRVAHLRCAGAIYINMDSLAKLMGGKTIDGE